MAKNTKENIVSYGDVEDDFQNEESEQPTEKIKGEKKYLRFLADERFLKSLGLFFLLFSIFLFVSGVSFLMSWQADQSLIRGISFGMFSLSDPASVENVLGTIGAWIAYVFFYKAFGISSFAFCLIFFSVGVFLLTKLQPIPILKTLRYSFFIVIWLSLATGFLFNEQYQILGGVFGHFGYLFLKNLIGSLGMGLCLITYALIFLVSVFNIEFYKPGLNLASENNDNSNLESNQTGNKIFPLDENTNELIIENTIDNNLSDEIVDEISVPIEIETANTLDETIIEPTEVIIDDTNLVLEVNTATEEEIVKPIKKHYSIDEAYDPTLEFGNYQLPGLDLLNDFEVGKTKVDTKELNEKKQMIVDTLQNYNIGIKKISATIGPTVTLYEIIPQEGIRIAKIKNLEDDIALSLAALGIRIIAPIPGRGTIGIEVPNSSPSIVTMKSVLSSAKFQNSEMDLPIAFGKTISNEVFVTDLAKMPHLLMAGATGQGKSVGLNAVLVSLLYKKHPSQIKFVLVDPKKVELSIYKTIERHFLAKIPGDADAIITDTKLVVNTLNSLCKEMDDRYNLLKDAQVRNIKEYNAKFISRKLNPENGHKYLPYIILVIDELADLMMTAGKEVEMPIARIAQLARAIGIHLILATQRPSVNIITGTIKANFPARMAFRVSQKIDSRTILDANGADQLIGKGDMLYSNGNDLVRLQCAFVDLPEVEKIANFIGNQNGKEPYELPLVLNENEGMSGEGFDSHDKDDLFEDAARLIVTHQQGSTSLIQRKLNLGYNRAGRLIDQLEKAGIVGPFKGSKAREVLVKSEMELQEFLRKI